MYGSKTENVVLWRNCLGFIWDNFKKYYIVTTKNVKKLYTKLIRCLGKYFSIEIFK